MNFFVSIYFVVGKDADACFRVAFLFGVDGYMFCWLQEQSVETSNHEGRQKQVEENPHWSGQYASIFVFSNPEWDVRPRAAC